MIKTINLTVRLDVEVPDDYNDDDYIVQELNYDFSSFDENVKVVDSEICGVNE